MELLLILIVGGIVASFACGVGRSYGNRIAAKWQRPPNRLSPRRKSG